MGGMSGTVLKRREKGERWKYTRAMELEPRVVQWLVHESGIRRTVLARMMGVRPNVLDRWMETGRMTYARIERLAKCTRRPVLLFFHKRPLPDPPITDYRGNAVSCTAVGTAPALSPDDIVAVREARWLQGQAGEMLDDLVKEARRTDATPHHRERAARMLDGLGWIGDKDDEKTGFKMWTNSQLNNDTLERRDATVEDDPHRMSIRVLRFMRLPVPVFGERVPPLGFDMLRNAVEVWGNTIVLQADMDMETVRSVVLFGGEGREADTPPSTPHVILLNAGDAEGVRSFSLLHGYGHVLLGRGMGWNGKGGCICREGGHGVRRSGRPCMDSDREEMWCDRFAAAAMLPHCQFMDDRRELESECTLPWRTGAKAMSVAGSLADAYRTSRYSVAVRALDMRDDMSSLERYEDLSIEVANTAGTSYGGPAETRIDRDRGNVAACCESRRGRRLIRTALAAHALERETTHDVIDMLGIWVDDIGAVENMADEWPVAVPNWIKADDGSIVRGGR